MTSVQSATTPTTTATTATTSNAADSQALDQNFDQFLQMLTTQLQNQDPLSPMDTTQFTNQLVMFSQVEQQLKSNDTLNKLLTMQTINMTSLGVSFIGKNVQVAGSDFTTDGTNPVKLAYSLPATAASGTMSIKDANGNVVYSKPIDLSTGTHDMTWDGTESDGSKAPAGTYTMTLTAVDQSGASLNVTGFVPGHVSGIETADDGTLMLSVGNNLVPMTSVRQVSDSAS